MVSQGNISYKLTDPRILAELGERLTRHRLNADRSQASLAQEAGVSKRTIERIESGHSVQLSNLIRVLRALMLTDRLEYLVPDAPSSPMERLKLGGNTRQRASRSNTAVNDESWTWADG